MAIDPLAFAWRVVKDGISANKALQLAREAGVGIRREAFLRAVGQVKAQYGQRLREFDRPLTRRPNRTEITQFDSKKYKGFAQYVDVFVRNKRTGAVEVRNRIVFSDRLLSRQGAIDQALRVTRNAIAQAPFNKNPWGYEFDSDVLGGIYAATQEWVPTLV